MSSTSYSSYTIHDNEQFMAHWQDVINEDGLTFWFGFKNGSNLHQSGDLQSVVQTWSNHVGATIYVHYFKVLDAYRIGQIYDSNIALQVRDAVFILKCNPISTSPVRPNLTSLVEIPPVTMRPSVALQASSLSVDDIYITPHSCGGQHIRKPRNAWIIFPKVISQMWKKTPRPVKDLYTDRSHKEKADLLARYPNYKVQPRKSSEIKKRVKKKYPAKMTVEKLNQWILDGDVQVQTAFSGDSRNVTHLTISDTAAFEEANKTILSENHIRTEADQQIISAILTAENTIAASEAEIQTQVSEIDF
ncbi:putative mating-type protein mat a-1 [Golovinomyces cichoracearum]|uniref:Putative mating-type protein mat a-1 n=1 Tax=Golovinomyces cichoracearum TaxID=62708 RepID=A0A420HC48_9PEZI|nr:putative mating-type protein mat a-1 [Golovinomyces cichoracearum]